MVNKYSLISLFSGAGGMDVGFQMDGSFKVLLANDILSKPASTYAQNFGCTVVDIKDFEQNKNCNTPVYLLGDISEMDFSRVGVDADIVVGGPPCQDFSVIRGIERERQGIKVKRGWLYAHFIRCLIHIQPKIFVFENVPGLKSANKGMAYKTIVEDFSKLKFSWEEVKNITGNNNHRKVNNYFVVFSDVVDSADLGVPQRRKRLIIIGVREDLINGDPSKARIIKQKVQSVLLGEDSMFKKYPLTPFEVFYGKPLPELQSEYTETMKEYEHVVQAVRTERALKWNLEVWSKLSFDVVEDYLFINCIKERNLNELNRAFEKHTDLLKELGYYQKKLEGETFPDSSNVIPKETANVLERLKMIPPDENHEFVRGTKWEVEGKGISLIYRRLHPLKPSYTVVAYGGGGTWGYHYRRERGKLTNRERARLQTFPDDFLFRGNPAEVRAQVGEAVPPLLGKKISQVLKMILEEA